MNKSFGTELNSRAAGACGRTRIGRAAWGAFGLALALLGAQAWAAPFAYIPSNTNRQVVTIDLATNLLLAGQITVGSGAFSVAVNPVLNRAYVANSSDSPGTVTVIDATTSTKLTTIPTGKTPFGIAVNPAGTRVYVANFTEGDVATIDTATNSLIGLAVQVGTNPAGIAVNPAGTRLYVTNRGSNSLSVVDTSNNQVVTVPLGAATAPNGVAFNPVQPRAYVANTGTGTVSVIDTTLNSVLTTVAVGASPFGIVVNRAGDRAYITNFVAAGTVTVLDLATNQVTKTITGVGNQPIGIDIAPDGNTLYVANFGGGTVQRIAVNTLTTTGTAINVGPSSAAFGTFIIAPQPCTFSLSSTSATSPATGGAGSVTVTASAPACTWTATSNSSFITIPVGSFTGSGPLAYQVGANSGTARTGTITVAGQTFTVIQAGTVVGPPQAGVSLTSATLTGGLCTISGTALDANGNPAVALALASGRCMFTASPQALQCSTGDLTANSPLGHFQLNNLPLESDGSVLLQIFVQGLVSLAQRIPGCRL